MTPPEFIAGDCTERLAEIPADSVNLIVTSPPYPRVGLEYGDQWSDAEWLDLMRSFLGGAARVLASNGSLWLNLGHGIGKDGSRIPLAYLVFPLLRELGLHLRQEVIWRKQFRGTRSNRLLTTRTERWLWLVKDPSSYTFNLDAIRRPVSENLTQSEANNPLGANPGDVWEFNSVVGSAKDRPDHPCPFPLPMIERVILGWSNPGDVVLDPFAGSGTTALAAMRLGRRSISMESNASYVGVAANRLLNEQADEIARQAEEIARLKAELDAARLTPASEAVDIEKVRKAVAEASSKAQALRALGAPLNTFSYRKLDRIAASHAISTAHFLGQGWRRRPPRSLSEAA